MDETPAPVRLAVVRQDQASAYAVVPEIGTEWSLLPAPNQARRLRPGDLVAVRAERIVYSWRRALVLRVTPDGIRVRLPDGTQCVLPAHVETLGAPEDLRPGDAVFADDSEVLARAWPWFEPVLPPPALLAHAARVVAGASG